jgi:hypothetical protein
MVPIITLETHTEPKIPASEICCCILKLRSLEITPQLFATDLPAGVFLACFCRNCLRVLSRSN